MNVGTKSVLFGVHQFILHPILVFYAWRILYKDWPTLAQWCAIITHDLGYWGKPNMDGPEGQTHPEAAARWWRKYFGADSRGWPLENQPFGERVAREILGHSRFHATNNGLPLSKLYRPDKLATALYPRWLYLLLGTASGEIREYMAHYAEGHYTGKATKHNSRTAWLVEVQAVCAMLGIEGDNSEILKKQQAEGHEGPEFGDGPEFEGWEERSGRKVFGWLAYFGSADDGWEFIKTPEEAKRAEENGWTVKRVFE